MSKILTKGPFKKLNMYQVIMNLKAYISVKKKGYSNDVGMLYTMQS